VTDLPVTLFDLLVVAVLLLSTVVALSRGFVREAVGLVSWVGAAAAAWYAFGPARVLARDAIGPGLVADLVAGAVAFLVPFIVLRVVGGMVAGGVDRLGGAGIDRVLGIGYGVARGAVLVCAAWLIYLALAGTAPAPAWVREGYFFAPVDRGAHLLRGLLPEDVAAQGRAAAERAGQGARQIGTVGDALAKPRGAAPSPPGYGPEQRRAMDQLFSGEER
jgi:membrane protein required for colicin V production